MRISVFSWTDRHIADIEAEVSDDRKTLTVDTSEPGCDERVLRFGNYVEIDGHRARVDKPQVMEDDKVTYTLYEVEL